MGSEGFGPRVAFEIFGIQITETITVTWLVMALMTVFCVLATRKMRRTPRGIQLVGEIFVKTIEGLTSSNMGQKNIGFAPFIGALIMFLAIGNIVGILGLRPPTADLNTTMALSVTTFVLTQYFGLRAKGLGGYVKGYFEPIFLLFPLNVIGELSNPVSLGFRIFGNVLAGVIIMSLVYSGLGGILGPVFQFAVPIPLHMYFDLFSGLLQSFIFTMLTMVFISGAME